MRRLLLLTSAFFIAILAVTLLPGGSKPTSSYNLIGAPWPSEAMPIRYCINVSGIPYFTTGQQVITPDQFIRLVQDAFAKWESPRDSYFRSQYLGTCGFDPLFEDGVNVVGWRRLPGGAIGVTFLEPFRASLFRRDLFLREVDVIMDSEYANEIDPGAYVNTALFSILIHEFGHFIGIDHTNVACSIMTPNISRPSATNPEYGRTTLCDDDLMAARALYPGPERATNMSVSEAACAGGGVDVTFRWTPSREADGYFVDVTQVPGFASWLPVFIGNPNQSAVRVAGLASGRSHYWRMWNFALGAGSHLGGWGFTTPDCSSGVPIPAGNVELEARPRCAPGSATVDFLWARSLAADGYFVDVSTDQQFNGWGSQFVPGEGNNILTWRNLPSNTTHYFRIFSFNGFGGRHSTTATFRTPPC